MTRDVSLLNQLLAVESGRSLGTTRVRRSAAALQGELAGLNESRPLKVFMKRCLIWIALISPMIANNAAVSQETPEPRGKLQYNARTGAALTLIDSSDLKFEAELEANFPGVLAMKSIEKALPYMVILRNDTAKTVRAYEIRWEDADSGSDMSGGMDLLKATALTTPLELRWPSGNKLQDKSIRPGEERLVTPWSNVRRDELSFFDPSFEPQTLASHQSWRAHVDCVVYGDGSFDGPNQSRLLLTYFITRDAQHDEALTILQHLRVKPGDPKLKQQLGRRTDIGGSSSFNSNRAMAVYKRARAVAAHEFSQVLLDGRYHAVGDLASELVSTMPPYERFTKLAEPYRRALFTIGEEKVKAEE